MNTLSDRPDEVPVAAAAPRAPGRLRRLLARLWRSRLLRLALALLVVLAVLAGLAVAVMRVLGPRERFAPLTLPYVQDFADVDVKAWFSNEGIWSLRQEMLAQAANLNKPAYLYLPGKLADEQPYHLSTFVTLAKPTQEAGISFNAQYPKMTTQQHKVFIARVPPSEEQAASGETTPDMALVAGYTDDEGAFVPQVSVPFALEADEYRLDLYVLGNTYTVQLNGQTLIERRPLFYPNGLVGFYTLGPAKFDSLKITTAELEQPGEQIYVSDFGATHGGAGWVPFSGDWEVADGDLVQANPAAQDAGIGYEGSAFENYVVQASFHHLTGAGGGLLFNMVSPYQLNGSYLVRYADQSDSVFWGYFDAEGRFTRQGYAEVAAPGTDPHRLAVYVGAGSYDLYLDDQLLARSVPLQAQAPDQEGEHTGGHVGLITSLSSVAYAQVEVYPLFADAPVPLAPPQPPPPAEVTPTPTATPTATATQVPATPTPRPSPTAQPLAEEKPGLALDEDVPVAATAPVQRPTATATAFVTTTSTAAPVATSAPGAARASPTPLPADSSILVRGGASPWQAELRGDLREAGWRPLAGRWRFTNGDLVQDDAAGFDQAIVYSGKAFRDFSYAASFTHQDGNGAGILFNMPYVDRLNGAHMVRYADRRPGGIFWGYYDDTGRFVGQGYANVDPPGDVRHTLRVTSDEATYSVYLDDVLLATNLPLQHPYGYVGLLTSQSSATYDSVQVAGVQGILAADQTPVAVQPLTPAGVYSSTAGFPDQRVVSGKWVVERGLYRQSVPDPADYILNTGLYAGDYTIVADLLMSDKPDIGAGFMVQMPERGRKAGATVVRLINGGDGVFWGVYDETGSFRGRGSADLPMKDEGEGTYQLRVDVREGEMAIAIDGETIAEGLDLPRTAGWIALMAYGGPVTFANVVITVR